MKRRSFLKGLGVALLAPTVLLTKEVKAVPVTSTEDNTSVHVIDWNQNSYKYVRKTKLPEVKWRKLHEGVDYNKGNHGRS
jgi:hypothetical protein